MDLVDTPAENSQKTMRFTTLLTNAAALTKIIPMELLATPFIIFANIRIGRCLALHLSVLSGSRGWVKCSSAIDLVLCSSDA